MTTSRSRPRLSAAASRFDLSLETAAIIDLSSASASLARSWSRRTSSASRSLPAARRTASLLTADAAEDCAPCWTTLSASSSAVSGCHRLSPLRGEQHGRRDARLRASASNHPRHDRQRVCVSSLALIERGQIVERYCEIGMIGTKCGFTDRGRALVERLGIGKPALPFVEVGQIVQRSRHIGVIATEHLFADRQRPLRSPAQPRHIGPALWRPDRDC